MSRKSEKELYYLIKSLTKSERKKLSSQMNSIAVKGNRNHVKLYEIIDSLDFYEDELVKQKMRDENIKTPLPRLKNYLQEFILKILRDQHTESSIENKIRNLIIDSTICYSKGLKKIGNKKLDKALSLANEFGYLELSLDILKNKWQYQDQYFNESTLNEYKKTIVKLNNITSYRCLMNKSISIEKIGTTRHSAIDKSWKKVLSDLNLSNNNDSFSFEQAYYYQYISTQSHTFSNDSKKIETYLKMLVQRMELRGALKENYKFYFNALANYLKVLCINKKTEQAERIMLKLQTTLKWEMTPLEKQDLNNNITAAYCNLLKSYMLTHNKKKGNSIAEEAVNFVRSNRPSFYVKLPLYLALTNFYIYLRNFEEALKWNNKQLNTFDKNYYRDGYTVAITMNSIIHYELGNIELLAYLLRSAHRFLSKTITTNKTELVIISFIQKKLLNIKQKSDLLPLLLDLKLELVMTLKNKKEVRILEHVNFMMWLEAKIKCLSK